MNIIILMYFVQMNSKKKNKKLHSDGRYYQRRERKVFDKGEGK